ncbi:MAG: hypothetical protein JWO03_256 [Bacteroidetes bacterium]|nr:hypothetical protein [Bacteroidota bacterium]
MKKILLLLSLCLCALYSSAQEEENIVPDQFIVHLRGGISTNDFLKTYPETKIVHCLSKSMNIWLFHSGNMSLLNTIKSDPSVIAAQYNHNNVKRRSLVPNDTYFGNQWNMLNLGHAGADISATQAWQVNHSAVTQTGDTIVIAVIDGTFDIYHEDLNFFVNKNEIPYNGIDDDGNGYIDDYKGWNVFTNNDSVYDTFDAHGTHVAGIAAAKGNDSVGVAGVCWGAKVLAIDGSSTLESDVVKAYDYVIEMRRLYDQTSGARGAFIVATNSSFGVDRGHPASYPIWCALYDSMGHYGILSACATANNSYDVDQVGDIPTECPSRWMIAVTNTTVLDTRNGGAAFGPINIDLGAPGSAIESAFPGNIYGTLSGTSMASPHVAGAVAAMMANACPRFINDYFAYPDSLALILRDYMFSSVDAISDLTNLTVTGGRLNLFHAYLAQSGYNCNNCNFNVQLVRQNETCHGDSSALILAFPSPFGSNYHYLWSTHDSVANLSNLRAGFYQVTVTDTAGCQRTFTTSIKQPSAISISNITVVPFSGTSNGNVIFTASAGNDTLYYQMDTSSFQTGAIFVIDTPGVHHYRIRNAFGCEVDGIIGVYHVGIQDVRSFSYVNLAPNPTSGMADLTLKSDIPYDAQLLFTDLTGRTVSQQPLQITTGLQQKLIDLSSMADGIYILSIVSDGQKLASMKISLIK